ncbi:hypothetical protein [Marinicauda sp. Alg238-R41]|uniref:hypothetical protein n=1 Tax=Marinicauda sp. Alg238-R41 TaxID=2993447 RepID=UPI0022E26155|nr:hypothetical protein [Marinicauda sp. Alg238-R41]
MADVSLCVIDGCINPRSRSRGMCNAHYLRFLRRGDPNSGRTMNGDQQKYLLSHMWDECPKWQFPRMKDGYAQIVWDGCRGKLVHRIVCEIAHGPPPSPDSEAAHACGLGHEGCFGAACLSWKDRAGNIADMVAHGNSRWGERSNWAKLTRGQAEEVLSLLNVPNRVLADRFGVTTDTIQNIKTGKTWRHLKRV